MFRLNIAYFITHCPHITKRYIWVFRLNIAYFITLAVLVHRREAGTVPPKITVIKPNNDKSDRVSAVLSRFLWLVHMITPVKSFEPVDIRIKTAPITSYFGECWCRSSA